MSKKTASVLAFERKLDPSDALFFCGAWDQREDSANWSPVQIREKSVRGTISNRLKAKDRIRRSSTPPSRIPTFRRWMSPRCRWGPTP